MRCVFECSLSNKRLYKETRQGFKRCSGVCLTNDDIRTHTLQPNEIAKKIYTKRESANPTKVELYPPRHDVDEHLIMILKPIELPHFHRKDYGRRNL